MCWCSTPPPLPPDFMTRCGTGRLGALPECRWPVLSHCTAVCSFDVGPA